MIKKETILNTMSADNGVRKLAHLHTDTETNVFKSVLEKSCYMLLNMKNASDIPLSVPTINAYAKSVANADLSKSTELSLKVPLAMAAVLPTHLKEIGVNKMTLDDILGLALSLHHTVDGYGVQEGVSAPYAEPAMDIAQRYLASYGTWRMHWADWSKYDPKTLSWFSDSYVTDELETMPSVKELLCKINGIDKPTSKHMIALLAEFNSHVLAIPTLLYVQLDMQEVIGTIDVGKHDPDLFKAAEYQYGLPRLYTNVVDASLVDLGAVQKYMNSLMG